MVVDALTKRHGNSVTMLRLLRDGVLSIVDENRELAMRKVYRETHKRNLRPHQQLEQARGLFSHDQGRLLVAILEQSFLSFSLTSPLSSSALFLGMWCILICHPHLTSIIICLTTVWEQACVTEHKNKFCHYRASLFTRCPKSFVVCCWCFWWKQFHDTAISGTDYLDLRNRVNFCSVCVGEHVTVSRYC